MSAGHILVVDDEPGMLKYLQTVLELDSYRVTTATNGTEALEKVQRCNPDLVLLDVVMPGADGLETLQRIREARPSTKVVMRTRHPQGGSSDAVRRAGLSLQARTERGDGRSTAFLPGEYRSR